jgi:pentatricopeptide repeat protein
VSIQALATEFNRAVHAKNFVHARSIVDSMRTEGASVAFATLYEALYLSWSEPNRNGEALRMILDGILDCAVVDPVDWAKACSTATRLADTINETTISAHLRTYIAWLRSEYGHDREVFVWTVGSTFNLGRGLIRNKRFDEAISLFEEMLALDLSDPAMACWPSVANMNMAMCYAKMRNIERAKSYVQRAESDTRHVGDAFTTLVRAEIAFADDDFKTAISLGRSAYRQARDSNYVVIMAESALFLCSAYAETGNCDAFITPLSKLTS